MGNSQHQFQPLVAVHKIPVHWELSKTDYDRLRLGNEESLNNWHFIFEKNYIHIYKGFDGIEHYRFALHEQASGGYVVKKLEVRDNPNFYEAAERNGWSRTAVNKHQSTSANNAIEEVVSMLLHFLS